jgi:hypothetical protein
MGADGPVSGIKVGLPAALQHYQMRWPEDAGGLTRAVRASLGMLAVAPDQITMPRLAAVYRAAVGKVDFIAGRTGCSKVLWRLCASSISER